MANSSYYYSEMAKYGRLKRNSEEKRENYQAYLKKVKNLENNLIDIADKMNSAYNSFNNGGYVDNGETLDKGILKENLSKLKSNDEILISVIKKIETKINVLSQEIEKYSSLYKESNSNYIRAKKEEAK